MSSDVDDVADLVKGFSILDGKVELTVPDVEPGNDYRIVCAYYPSLLYGGRVADVYMIVFGDSGNWGETFTIQN